MYIEQVKEAARHGEIVSVILYRIINREWIMQIIMENETVETVCNQYVPICWGHNLEGAVKSAQVLTGVKRVTVDMNGWT